MKISPLLLAALLATGTGAWAQVRDGSAAPGEHAAAEGSADGRTFGEKVRAGADKVGDATRRVFNKAKGETREAARDTKRETRQAKNEARQDDRHASKDMDKSGQRHARKAGARAGDRSDTRAMGAPGRTLDADPDQSRRERMDEAYRNWKSQHKG